MFFCFLLVFLSYCFLFVLFLREREEGREGERKKGREGEVGWERQGLGGLVEGEKYDKKILFEKYFNKNN